MLPPRRDYVQRILDLYRCTPTTSGRVRRADRHLATTLHERNVPLDTIHAALLVATGRRTLRSADAPPLGKIASLHYFLPVIDELLAAPLDPSYLEYLRRRLATLAPGLAAPAGGHRFP
jgi:hypothetical protein